jgi:DNA primase small subunit
MTFVLVAQVPSSNPGANICLVCWDFMTISIQVIHRALKEDFGFKNILWIYSGRRGVHCWVCDPHARSLPADARKGIVNYLEVIKGGKEQSKKVNLKGTLHPSLNEAYKVCADHFPKTLLDNMAILDKPEHWDKVLQLIPDEEIKRNLVAEWTSGKKTLTSKEKWTQIENEIRWAKVLALTLETDACHDLA